MALIECPECGQKISDKAPACIHCGFPLSLINETNKDSNAICPKCGKALPSNAKVCCYCGGALTEASTNNTQDAKNKQENDKPEVKSKRSSYCTPEFVLKKTSTDKDGANYIVNGTVLIGSVNQDEIVEILDYEGARITRACVLKSYDTIGRAHILLDEKNISNIIACCYIVKCNCNTNHHNINEEYLQSLNQGQKPSQAPNTTTNYTVWYDDDDDEDDVEAKANFSPPPKAEIVTCPKCGSSQIQLAKKGFGLGKAAAGLILLGPVGLVGGAIGAQDAVRICMSCKHKF